MEIIPQILSYSGIVLGALLVALGLYGIVTKKTYFFSKGKSEPELTTGPKVFKISLYYLFVGTVWVWYSFSRLFDF